MATLYSLSRDVSRIRISDFILEGNHDSICEAFEDSKALFESNPRLLGNSLILGRLEVMRHILNKDEQLSLLKIAFSPEFLVDYLLRPPSH